MSGNPVFEMSKAFPQLDDYYGVLSGPAYTIPYSVAGLLSSVLTKHPRRHIILSVAMAGLSLFTISNGFCQFFWAICLFRILHGAASSSLQPISFQLVADYFPIEQRGTANAALSAANFFGVAMSSMSILLIKAMGWRGAYISMGAAGVFSGLFGLLTLYAPSKRK